MASYTPCAGTGKAAENVHRTSWDIGPKFGGKLIGTCPECKRGVKPTTGNRVPAHKHRSECDW